MDGEQEEWVVVVVGGDVRWNPHIFVFAGPTTKCGLGPNATV